jgi:hypothetical protein
MPSGSVHWAIAAALREVSFRLREKLMFRMVRMAEELRSRAEAALG